MEFLHRFLPKPKYNTWEARGSNDFSHYEKGYIPEAMRILFNARKEIQASINDYCDNIYDKIRSGTFDEVVARGSWESILSEYLLPRFLNDHKEISNKFNERK